MMGKIRKRKQRYLALAAAVMISLTGCCLPFSKEETKIEVQTGGELTLDSVIMRVGEVGVTYREALLYIYQLKERYEPGFGENIWDFTLEGDQSFGEYAKEEVMNNLIQIKVITQQAQKEEVALTEDEIAEISGEAEDYLDGIKSADIKKYGLTKELIASVYEENRLAEKMFDVTTSVVSTDISDEEAKQTGLAYLLVMTNGTDRNGKKVSVQGKKGLKEALERARNLRKQAKTAADFGNFADANSDLEEHEITYGSMDLEDTENLQLPEAVLLRGLKMKTGEMSKVLKTEEGYYLLYCVNEFDEDATRAKKEEMIENEQERVFSEAYEQWLSGYEVEVAKKLWEEISFQGL